MVAFLIRIHMCSLRCLRAKVIRTIVLLAGFITLHSGFVSVALAAADTPDDEVAVVNGSPFAPATYPALTALVTGRSASISLNNQQQISGWFFGHGVNTAFAGEVVDCGLAMNTCANSAGRLCLIETNSQLADSLSPASQLANCTLGGGTGALFKAQKGVFPRTDMFDGTPQIPAVFVAEPLAALTLADAMAGGALSVEVEPRVSDTVLCGATWLGGPWVVTAAHCVLEQTPDGLRRIQPWEITASVGAHDLSRDQHLAQSIEEIFVAGNPLQNTEMQSIETSGDVALLKLVDVPTVNNTASPMRLAANNAVDTLEAQSARAVVLGWGSTLVREPDEPVVNLDTTSRTPLSAVVTLIPLDQCRVMWRDFFTANNIAPDAIEFNNMQLCAFDPVTQRDTCQGDSGGPLVVDVDGKPELAGITSFGLGCGSANSVPAVYTRVGDYADWINDITGINVTSATRPTVSVNSTLAVNSAVFTTGSTGAGSTDVQALLPLLCLSLLLALNGCRNAPSVKIPVEDVKPPESMDILFSPDEVIFNVISNGCTSPDHFVVKEDPGGACAYVIERVTPDLCRRSSFVTRVTKAWNQTSCSADEVVFNNPRL